MDYKINLFSWVLIAGVLGASLVYGRAVSPDFEELREGFNINSKNDTKWEGLLFSHKVSPLKKCFPSLFIEKINSVIICRIGFGHYLKSFFPSISIKSVLGHISINAP